MPATTIRFAACVCAAVLVCAQTLVPQGEIHVFLGSAGSESGSAADGAGDVDGDGLDDILVGAPNDSSGGPAAGSVELRAAADGRLLQRVNGTAYDALGTAVANVGDTDGDGVADWAAGAPGAANGRVLVMSGPILRFDLRGAAAGDRFGASLDGAGDVNGDGYADLIVGAPGNDLGGIDAGRATVISGLDGQVLWTWTGSAIGDALGYAVAGVGDVNGDGRDDVVVGSPFFDNGTLDRGLATLYSGADGSAIRSFVGVGGGDNLGRAVAGAGDVDGDGVPDIVVGVPLADGVGPDAGRVFVFSGRTGASIHTLDGEAAYGLFGQSVDGAGDVDADGFCDVVAGAPWDGANGVAAGSARLFSGASGAVLFEWRGAAAFDELGTTVRGAGDVDGDGFADLVAGAWGDDRGGDEGGSAQVYSGIGGRAFPARLRRYGRSCPSAAGLLPHSGALGRPVIGTSVRWRLTTAPAHAPAVLLIGAVRASLTLQVLGAPGCWLQNSAQALIPGQTDGAGQWQVPLAIPNDVALLGGDLHGQFGVADGANGLGLITTDGTTLTVGR